MCALCTGKGWTVVASTHHHSALSTFLAKFHATIHCRPLYFLYLPIAATVDLPIASKQYIRSLFEQNMLKFFIMAKARETQQLFVVLRYHQLKSPPLAIKVPRIINQRALTRATLTFTNYFPFSLTHIIFDIGGQSLCVHKEVAYR